MSIKRLSTFILLSSSLFLLTSACLLVLYAALSFSPGHHFHCCQPTGLSFAGASAIALLLPLLLALSGIFGWASLRTGRVPATLLHLAALLLLILIALFIGSLCQANRVGALQIVERNFQLVRDCRTDWLVDQLQTALNCSGWNLTTAHRSVCPSGADGQGLGGVGSKINGSTSAWTAGAVGRLPEPPAKSPCRDPVTRLSYRAAGAALAFGLIVALLALANLGCQCAYQWRISDPERRRELNQVQLELRRQQLAHSAANWSTNSTKRRWQDDSGGGASTAPARRPPPKRRAPEPPPAAAAAGATAQVKARADPSEPLLLDDGEV